jgi:hypothetical protein
MTEIRAQSGQPVARELQPLTDQALRRFGAAVEGVLFYGSCLRSGKPTEGVVDLYVLVDNYAHAFPRRLLRWANACLPPNVFMLHASAADGQVLRAKCAVLSLTHFERGTGQWFQSYLWGRFAQPSRLVFSRNAEVRERIHRALAQAVVTLHRRTLPAMPDRFTADELWCRALSLSYATELRPEAAGRPDELVQHDASGYRRLSATVVPALAEMVLLGDNLYGSRLPPAARQRGMRQWQWRRLQGRTLNVARLMKSVLTFENGVDYVVWKLERHTGEKIEVSPRLRRYPLIFGWPLLWRLLRERRLR